MTEIARSLVLRGKAVHLPSHAYTGDDIHQEGHNDGGTGAELAGDGLGSEAGAAGHGTFFNGKATSTMMVPWMRTCCTDTITPSRLPDKNKLPLFCVSIDLKKTLQRGGITARYKTR